MAQQTKKVTKKRSKEEKPSWLKITQKELETVIIKLAKQGLTTEKIGLVLRDSYGIPKTKLLGTKISKVLKEKGLYKDANLTNLNNKKEGITKHLEKNKQDKRAKRAFTIIRARISKLQKYNKRKKSE